MALLALGGCSPYLNESATYRDAVMIDGYEVVRVGSGERSAYSLWVGPPRSDEELVSSVTAPHLDISIQSDATFPRVGSVRGVAAGVGTADATGRCTVWLIAVDPGNAAVEYAGRESLTDEQRAGVATGDLALLEVEVLCEAQADR